MPVGCKLFDRISVSGKIVTLRSNIFNSLIIDAAITGFLRSVNELIFESIRKLADVSYAVSD